VELVVVRVVVARRPSVGGSIAFYEIALTPRLTTVASVVPRSKLTGKAQDLHPDEGGARALCSVGPALYRCGVKVFGGRTDDLHHARTTLGQAAAYRHPTVPGTKGLWP